MRWKKKEAAAVLSLRSLAHTDCRRDQFWGKIDQYGYPLAAQDGLNERGVIFRLY